MKSVLLKIQVFVNQGEVQNECFEYDLLRHSDWVEVLKLQPISTATLIY